MLPGQYFVVDNITLATNLQQHIEQLWRSIDFFHAANYAFVRIRSHEVRAVYFADELASKTDPYRLEIMDPEQVSKLGACAAFIPN